MNVPILVEELFSPRLDLLDFLDRAKSGRNQVPVVANRNIAALLKLNRGILFSAHE
jgi:hypothetical protein